MQSIKNLHEYEILLPREMYRTLRPAIYVGRIGGLCPVKIVKEHSNYKLVWSWRVMTGAFILMMACDCATAFYYKEKHNYGQKTPTQAIVLLSRDLYFLSSYLWTVLCTPFAFEHFFHFLQHITKVDQLFLRQLKINQRESYIRTVLFAIFADYGWLLYSVWDNIHKYVTRETWYYVPGGLIAAFISGHGTLVVVNYYVLANLIKARVCRVNKCLLKMLTREEIQNSVKGRINAVTNLIQIHRELANASVALNRQYGIYLVLVAVGFLIRFMMAIYRALHEISTKGAIVAPIIIIMISVYMMRVLLVVHPCEKCRQEVQRSKDFTCKLLLSEKSEEMKEQLKLFLTQLKHHPLEFTMSGFANIESSLLISMVSFIVTNFIILLRSQ